MKNKDKPLIAVTPGDIGGIGPEIVAKVIIEGPPDNGRLLLVEDAQVIRSSFDALGAHFDLPIFQNIEDAVKSDAPVAVLDLAQGGKELLALGRPDPKTGELQALALVKAVNLAMDGWVDGVVYGPIVKESLHIGEEKYLEEEEILREVLRSPDLKGVGKLGGVYRYTIVEHVPVREVADLITQQSVLKAIEALHEALLSYGLKSPRIVVGALNPHAGDGGIIGREEIDEITPAIKNARSKGIDASGPIPADTVYVRALQGEFDGVVSMTHDQALAAMKAAGFGKIVIIHTHCPIIITTPSHGSAFNIAGQGIADHKNMREAIEVATNLAQRRKQVNK
ncbi:MAG: PdxA family protein [Dehalococcoidales bacterium]